MAQLVARFHGMEEATGSNPVSSTPATAALARVNEPSQSGFSDGRRTEPAQPFAGRRIERQLQQARTIVLGRLRIITEETLTGQTLVAARCGAVHRSVGGLPLG